MKEFIFTISRRTHCCKKYKTRLTKVLCSLMDNLHPSETKSPILLKRSKTTVKRIFSCVLRNVHTTFPHLFVKHKILWNFFKSEWHFKNVCFILIMKEYCISMIKKSFIKKMCIGKGIHSHILHIDWFVIFKENIFSWFPYLIILFSRASLYTKVK